MGKCFLPKASGMSFAAINAAKNSPFRTNVNLMNEPEKTIMTCVIKNECQNWRNKINKAKKTPGFPATRLEEMQAAFEAFKKEALQRKQAVKKKEASPNEFSDWLLQQSNIIVELAEWES